MAVYTSLPGFDVRRGTALGVSLLSAVPKDPPASITEAARELPGAVVGLQAGWAKREATSSSSAREQDPKLDRAWSALEKPVDSARALQPASARRKAAAEGPGASCISQVDPAQRAILKSLRLLHLADDDDLADKIHPREGVVTTP